MHYICFLVFYVTGWGQEMLFSIIDTTTTDCRKLKVWYFPCLQLSDFLFFPPPMIRYQVSLIKMDGFVLFSRYIGCFYFILIWGEGVGKLSWNFLLSLMGVTYYCSVYFCDFPSINDRLPFLPLVMLFFRKKILFLLCLSPLVSFLSSVYVARFDSDLFTLSFYLQ